MWEIFRRYSQFVDLDERLREEFPERNGALLYLPKKGWWRSPTDPAFMAERKVLLQKYLNSVINSPELIVSSTFAAWLLPQNNVGLLNSFCSLSQPQHRSLKNPDKQGYLSKEGHVVKNWRECWFVLKGETLYYFKTKEVTKILGVIHLTDMVVREATEKNHKFCFTIRHKQNLYHPVYLAAATESEYKEWINSLKLCMYETHIPTKTHKQEWRSAPTSYPRGIYP